MLLLSSVLFVSSRFIHFKRFSFIIMYFIIIAIIAHITFVLNACTSLFLSKVVAVIVCLLLLSSENKNEKKLEREENDFFPFYWLFCRFCVVCCCAFSSFCVVVGSLKASNKSSTRHTPHEKKWFCFVPFFLSTKIQRQKTGCKLMLGTRTVIIFRSRWVIWICLSFVASRFLRDRSDSEC